MSPSKSAAIARRERLQGGVVPGERFSARSEAPPCRNGPVLALLSRWDVRRPVIIATISPTHDQFHFCLMHRNRNLAPPFNECRGRTARSLAGVHPPGPWAPAPTGPAGSTGGGQAHGADYGSQGLRGGACCVSLRPGCPEPRSQGTHTPVSRAAWFLYTQKRPQDTLEWTPTRTWLHELQDQL